MANDLSESEELLPQVDLTNPLLVHGTRTAWQIPRGAPLCAVGAGQDQGGGGTGMGAELAWRHLLGHLEMHWWEAGVRH